MKKRFIIIIAFVVSTMSALAQQNIPCCPDFTIEGLNGMGRECCMRCTAVADSLQTAGGGTSPGNGCMDNPIVACKNSYGNFVVYPNLPTFSYQWTITGGTPGTILNGNPVNILWGNGTNASITVVIIGPGCNKTITRKVCLLDKPTANFTYTPLTNICAFTPITFMNTSSGGSSFTWFFGDGNTSTVPNPVHTYGAAGSYTVSLVVSSASSGGNGPVNTFGCGCVDTIKKVIIVGNGPGIETCFKMICPNDTVEYCSTSTCTSYSWSITGGTIIGPANTKCIKVQWTTPPGSLTLNTTGCGACSTTTIIPNVIWPNLQITGPSPVCKGSTNSYSLPVIPGTFYSWSISPGVGATIMSGGFPYPNNYPVNNPTVNINFTQAGTYTLTGNYINPNTRKKCGGSDIIIINVLPKFNIYGPASVCQNTPGIYGTTDGSTAQWSITPASGYTPLTFPNSTVINVNWLTPGNYVLTSIPLIPGNYCNPTGVSIAIKVKPTPVLTFVLPQTTVCPNSLINYSITSTLPGNVTWSFTNGNGTIYPFGTDNTSASVDFTGSGPWTLKAEQTVNGCAGNVTVNISPVPPPPAITLSSPSICSGGTVTATVTGSIPAGGYTWSCNSGGVLTGGQGTLSATFTINSNTIITLKSCGGTSTISVTVTAITASIVRTNTACGANLTVSPAGSSYAWFLNGSPYTGPNTNPLVITQNGNYVVVVTYPGGCTATSQISVTGLNPVTVSISGIGNICNGNQVTLSASVTTGCINPTYLWSNGATGNPITVSTAGSYSVTVTCANGCTATSNVIIVPPCSTGGNPCINDLVISGNNDCNNPINLSVSTPTGCTPVNTTWYYGDGFSGPTGVHTYTNVGTYQVSVVMQCADGTYHCGTQIVKIPMVNAFTYVITCATNGWNVLLNDASITIPSYSGYTRTWSTTCGSLSSTTSATPTLFVPIGCNPTITLTITANGCTLIRTFTFSFPTTTFTIIGNAAPCKNVDYVYQSSFTSGIISYAWNFGDATSGVTNPISHHFSGTPVSPTISLTITDQWGCQFTANLPVMVKTPPALTITPSPIVKICPDCPPVTTSLNTSPSGFTGYQWYHNGAPITGANASSYQVCPGAGIGSYYVTATSATGPAGPCPVMSDTVKVVNHPKPDAKISPRNVQCVGGFPTTISNIMSGATYNPNYTYTWYLNNTGNQIFTSTTTNFLTYTIPSANCYVFIVKVSDNITNCVAYDTACICYSQIPNITIAPPGPFCAGTPQTFVATALPPVSLPNLYSYVWQDGTPGPSYTTSFAGIYTVTAANIYGCTNSANAIIKPLPYVALFPQGCDTLCLGDSLYFPIPLDNSGNPNYTITWYKGVTVIGTGFQISTTGLGLGSHTIHATVVMNGCTVTTAQLFLVLINCTPCDCKESHWGEIQLNEGDHPGAKNNNNNPQGGNPIILKCNSNQKLDCNKTYTVSSTYICKDTVCKAKTTYVLQPPAGGPQTGTGSITFTTNLAGTYTLTVYGWCGDKICDSCVIKFFVKCCDCKESKWDKITLTPGTPAKDDDNPAGAKIGIPDPNANPNPSNLALNCGKTYKLDCNKPYSINAAYLCKDTACKGKVTYSLQPPTGLPVNGSIPPVFNFIPSQNGTYTLTLYGWCGDKICDSCVIKFEVKCGCDCKESHWGEKTIAIGGAVKKLDCPGDYKVKCNQPVTINTNYNCVGANCKSGVSYSLQPPTGLPNTGSIPPALTFTPSLPGTYTLTLYGWCDGKICDSCVVKFTTDCLPPKSCCKDSIKVKPPQIQTSTLSNPAATVVNGSFSFIGPSGPLYTEIRAEVVSYNLFDNFNKECLNCKSYPFSWASIYQPGVIGAMQPQITMFNSTVNAFNPSGNGMYQNPREVIWSSATPFAIPPNINISFLLPPASIIDCCELTARICVKFTFRDNYCKECEALVCFSIPIKKK
jgi:PKD repeat protein